MKERISQLMDGELDERSAADTIKACAQGGEALEAWRSYHLISDAMRDSRVLSAGFSAGVMQRLAAEPTVLAPQRARAESRTWFLASAAASFAAVGLVGWLAFAPQPGSGPQVAQTAPQQQPAPEVAQVQPNLVPPPTAANDYLLAHQGFSPRVSFQGMAPYVRSVSTPAPAREARK
ncbi:MAG TPA: sigma-E factor negative regulatory protein [Burkholderiales bacterium]|jgi:sigma-E factor negative regulatory protein RseA